MKIPLVKAITGHHFVTVETADADVLIGTVSHRPEGGVIVRSGLPGRPFVLEVHDVIAVRLVDSSHPHVVR